MIKLHFYFRHNYLLCYILLPLHFAGIKPTAIPFPCILHVFPNFSCISFLEIGIQKCRDFANTNYLYTSIPVCTVLYIIVCTVQYYYLLRRKLHITSWRFWRNVCLNLCKKNLYPDQHHAWKVGSGSSLKSSGSATLVRHPLPAERCEFVTF